MKDISKKDIGRLCSLSDNAEKIAITAHLHPDGDAIGSTYALLKFLQGLGKDACIVLPDRYPESLSFIVGREDGSLIISAKDDKDSAERLIAGADLVFCLDFNNFTESRCGLLSEPLKALPASHRILIDHHLSPDTSLYALAFSETGVSSTCELLFWILMSMPQTDGKPSALPEAALSALLAGMTTDTNNFGNSVFPTTLRMASLILETGTDRDSILYHLYNEYGENRLRLLGRLLYKDMKITGDGVAYIIIGKDTLKEFDIQEGDTEGFVNKPLEIKKVRMSCLIKEDDGFMRVSLRSKRGISANACAREFFHGGGHELAAGGRLYIPDDIAGPEEAPAYIEKVTHIFMNRDNG